MAVEVLQEKAAELVGLLLVTSFVVFFYLYGVPWIRRFPYDSAKCLGMTRSLSQYPVTMLPLRWFLLGPKGQQRGLRRSEPPKPHPSSRMPRKSGSLSISLIQSPARASTTDLGSQ
jgi:hypothetical protein